MTPPIQIQRLPTLKRLLLLGYVVLAGWLGYWQLGRFPEFRELSASNRLIQWSVQARRGNILDANGTVLATSAPVKTVCVDPSLTLLPSELEHCRLLAASVIAESLQMDLSRVLDKIRPRWIVRADGNRVLDRYEILKHDVSLAEWSRLTNAMAQLEFPVDLKSIAWKDRTALKLMRRKLVFARDSYLRRYPCGSLAAHVLGFTTRKDVKQPYGGLVEERGRHGVELVLNQALKGVSGWQLGHQMVEARSGMNVVLTIDSGVQRIVEEELRRVVGEWQARGGVAVVVRPRTGDVLALASLPDFDPGNPTNVVGHVNLAVSEMLEPGSTMKAVTFAAGLEEQCFSWTEEVNCHHGYWQRPKDRIRDFHGYDTLTFLEVLMKSSNIGTAQLIQRIPVSRMLDLWEDFGFGEPTGILLPNEAPGMVNVPKRESEYLRTSYGQFISTTPIQMAMTYATIANGGLLMRPRVVARVEDDEGHVLLDFPPLPMRRVLSEATCTNLTAALREVVSDQGTGRGIQMDAYSCSGKTGTAQMYDNDSESYPPGMDYPSFVGFFPSTRPEICMLVGLIEPRKPGRHGGATVVGPAWKNMAEQIANYLRIAPDLQPVTDWLPGSTPEGLSPVVPFAARRAAGALLGTYW
jgi:cell division protein FtsI/penicillin-binding protein 2